MPVGSEKIVERSVDGLQKLYAVVVALAINQAVLNFLRDRDSAAALVSEQALRDIPELLALIVTVIPFYHGMNRHLERSYLERDAGPRHSALLLDFLAFFVEAFILLAAAWSVRRGIQCFLFLGMLLFVDVVWGWICHLIHYVGGKSTVLRWVAVNIVFIGAGVLIWRAFHETWLLGILAVFRSIADYWSGWEFYFPRFASIVDPSEKS
jgi:hypothetical protein